MFGRLFVESGSVKLKFDGELEGVNVNTFAKVVLDYAVVARSSIDEIKPAVPLDITITGAESGCLEAILQITPSAIDGTLDLIKGIAPVIPQVVSTTSEFYGLIKDFGKHGEPVQVEQKGSITNIKMRDGNNITVDARTFNLYTNDPRAANAVKSTFDTLEHTKEVDGFSVITATNQERFTADRDEFRMIADAPSSPSEPVTRVGTYEKIELVVVRPYLDVSTKNAWTFRKGGSTINARIVDEDFFRNFREMSFKVDDLLVADLEVTQVLNEKANIYEDKTYRVTKVYHKKDAPRNERLDI